MLFLNSDCDKKVFIVGVARSGTSQLAKIFINHPSLKGLSFETFFRNSKNLDLSIATEHQINLYFRYMFERYDVFKEIIINDKHNKAVRNYFFSTNINKIVIYRKNKLKQAISNVFSKTTQMWHPTEKDRDVYNKEIDGIKISLNEVRSTLNYINFQYKLLFKELKEKKHFLVVYEDLFFDNVENQKLLLKNMFNFCNLKFDEDQKIMNLLSNGRINSNETYKKIINHQEIEDAFGNKENGFLFD
jgi:predicted RNA binding protein with dsRBD fold (UPF0201 family)